MDNTDSAAPSARNILTATIVALVVATILLFTTILPAEYGIDPFGTGEMLGLTALSRAGDNPLENQLEIHKSDEVEFILGPFQSVEYKYLMDLENTMIFSWKASGELYYDMHAEPALLGEEGAESFGIGTASESMGSYHAPFAGIHGWFWENRSTEEIVLKLYTSGFYVTSTVFRDGGTFERQLNNVAQ